MIIKELNKWNEFSGCLNELYEEFGKQSYDTFTEDNRILYRGQANANWDLRNTLERFSDTQWSLNTYLDITMQCAPQIESYIDKEWQIPMRSTILDIIYSKPNDYSINLPIEVYEFWAYLRHHGFPSPFLDWTISPYIAAFFAFSENDISDKCAIFAYIETPKGVKTRWGNSPRINVLGPYIRTHKRHYLQQSWYTISIKPESINGRIEKVNDFRFICHDEILKKDRKDQDVLIKIILPRSERNNVLKYLNLYNINHYSLVPSEESLMKMLAFKEFNL